MSQPLHSPHERGAAVSRLERAGLDSATAAAVIEEIQRGEPRFATADQVGKIEVGLARLQGDVRAMESGLREVEARLGGRIDVLAAETASQLASFEARFDAVDIRFNVLRDELLGRMDEQFGALRRENRLLLLVFSTMLGLLVALFQIGVL